MIGVATMLSRLTIRMRLVILSVTLLVVTIGTNLYLTRTLAESAAGATAGGEVLHIVEKIHTVRSAFDELRYWMTDLSVSLLTQSEENAKAARKKVATAINALA